jgi:Protein of unknown function (DUF4031)
VILVDELTRFPGARVPFHRGSCHMTTDDLTPAGFEELHAFAEHMGLRREWFQEHPVMPHYDLTPSKRAYALACGATFIPMREQLLARRRTA